MVSERKSFAAYAVTAALLLSSLPALIVAAPTAHAAAKAPGGGGGSSAHLSSFQPFPAGPPTLAVTPPSGAYNATTVATVTGTNYITSSTVLTTVFFSCAGSPGSAATACSVTPGFSPDANGTVTATLTVNAGTVPPNQATGLPGTVTVSTRNFTGTLLATTAFTVNPPLLNNPVPAAGLPGSSTMVTGTGFVSGTTYTVLFFPPGGGAATVTLPAVAGPTGIITATILVPASTSAGSAFIQVNDATGNFLSGSFFTVLAPSLAATPSVVNPGQSTVVSGTGYVAGTVYTLSSTCGSGAGCTSPSTMTTTATTAGVISGTFTVPSGTAAQIVTFAASLNGTTLATTTLTVAPAPPPLAITVSPSTGVPNQQVTVAGTGFTNTTSVTVTFTPAGGTFPTVILPGQPVIGGAFSTNLVIPVGTVPSTATVTASGGGQSASQPFVVMTPTVTASTNSGAPTTSFTVSGSGFTANVPVSVTLGITGATPVATNTVAAVTSVSGTFANVAVTVPAGAAPGNYIVRAVDAASLAATTPFTVTPITTTTSGAGLSLVAVGGNGCTISGVSATAVPTQTLNAFLTGFQAGEVVNLIVNGTTVTTTTTANGSAIAVFTINSAALTAGTAYIVSAVGNKGTVATSMIALCPTTQSNNAPATGVAPGSPVGISGAGFASGEVVSETVFVSGTNPITVGAGAPGVTWAFTATAASNGVFGPGVYTPTNFAVYQARSTGLTSGLLATTTFTVTPPGLVGTSTPVYPCTSFVISATSGFSPTEVVSVMPWGGSTVTSTVNATGGFTATVTAPANTPVGNLTVLITSTRGLASVSQPITVPMAVLSATPNSGALNSAITASGLGYIPNSGVNLALYFAGANGQLVPASTVTSTAPVTASAAGTFSTSFMLNPTIQVLGGSYVISGTSSCSSQNTATTPVTITGISSTGGVTPTSNQPTTIYFAEGYTGRITSNARADFDEFISVLNPDNFTKTVTFTYQLQGSSTPVVTSTQVGPNSDILRSVNGDVGNDQIVSAIVSSNYRIAAERIINRTAPSGRLDSDSSLGNTAPGTTWYFAEGYTGVSFQEYLTVQNPGSVATLVTVTFLPQSVPASTPRTVSFSVPANSRATENIRRDYLPYSDKSVGMIVTSDQPVVAERVEYWGDGNGSAKFGAASKAGITGAAKQYFFAYGSDPGATAGNAGAAQQVNDESYVTVINPAPVVNGVPGSDATVLVSFFDMTGKPLGSKSITVSPATRETVVVNNVIAPVSGPYYTVVSSDQPIFAEKPQYIGGSPNAGMHPGTSPSGSPAGLNSVLFPNVNTASASGSPISETVFLLNPGATAITVNGTYYTPGGQTVSVAYTIGAGKLVVVNVNADAGGLPAGPLGAQYTTGSGGQFVAARISNTPDQLSYIGNQGVFNQ